MSRPYFVDEREFVPGRALVSVRGTCVQGHSTAHLSAGGHTIKCDGCDATEYVIHGYGTLEDDVRAAGYEFAPEPQAPCPARDDSTEVAGG